MSILNNVASAFDAFANEVVGDIVAEGGDLAGKLLVVGKAAGEQALEVVEGGFEDLVTKVGGAATKFVTNLFADPSLSGLEKANLATTQLVESAASSGITLAAHDATTLVKNAFLAVEAKLATL